jgi:hypothetical protein
MSRDITLHRETGFEPATARPPADRGERQMLPAASPRVPASPAPATSEPSDDAFGAIDARVGENAAERPTLDAQRIGCRTQAGCISAVGSITSARKACEYMNDWNCSAPSSSQIRPRAIWIPRIVIGRPAILGGPAVRLPAGLTGCRRSGRRGSRSRPPRARSGEPAARSVRRRARRAPSRPTGRAAPRGR